MLLHLGLVTLRFAYGRDRKPIICMRSGFLDVAMSPKTSLIYLWRHQDTSNNSRRNKIHLKIFLKISKKWKPTFFYFCGNRQVPNNPDGPFNKFSKLWNMGSTSSRKHEMEIWYMEPLSSNKNSAHLFETLKPRSQATLKP